ncbi:hypothetical protein E2C01_052201 [Portunus trituberculatus]|uniref:Uncharacterized protein n=1 Tax=Portunus trituberculatus TaxID=210409 RepID=A0A5B7GLA2_PORTR|nr:hypothetical protein [Portunus trituberculatus]
MEQCSASDSVFSDTLRVPPFTYNVEAWYLHLEAVWASTDLPHLQRYQTVVRALPSEIASRLYSVLASLPEADRYTAIKLANLEAFMWFRDACFDAQDSARYDGGRLSALLARLSDLNRVAVFPLSEEMVCHKLTSLLSQSVRPQLVAAPQALSME